MRPWVAWSNIKGGSDLEYCKDSTRWSEVIPLHLNLLCDSVKEVRWLYLFCWSQDKVTRPLLNARTPPFPVTGLQRWVHSAPEQPRWHRDAEMPAAFQLAGFAGEEEAMQGRATQLRFIAGIAPWTAFLCSEPTKHRLNSSAALRSVRDWIRKHLRLHGFKPVTWVPPKSFSEGPASVSTAVSLCSQCGSLIPRPWRAGFRRAGPAPGTERRPRRQGGTEGPQRHHSSGEGRIIPPGRRAKGNHVTGVESKGKGESSHRGGEQRQRGIISAGWRAKAPICWILSCPCRGAAWLSDPRQKLWTLDLAGNTNPCRCLCPSCHSRDTFTGAWLVAAFKWANRHTSSGVEGDSTEKETEAGHW